MDGIIQKTQEANLDGGVSMIGSDMAMSAQSVHSYIIIKFTANGGVHYNVAIVKFSVIKLNIIQIQEYGLVSGQCSFNCRRHYFDR